MARPRPTDLAAEKAELIATMDRSRQNLTRELDDVATALDLPYQFRSSFHSGKWRWLAGALAAGLAAGVLWPSGKRRGRRGKTASAVSASRPRDRSLLGMATSSLVRGMIVAAAQPAILVPLQKEAEKWFKARLQKS